MENTMRAAVRLLTASLFVTLVVGYSPARVDVGGFQSGAAGRGASVTTAYYPPRGDNNWTRKRPDEAGMDPQTLDEAITLAKASDTKEFTRDPREDIEIG